MRFLFRLKIILIKKLYLKAVEFQYILIKKCEYWVCGCTNFYTLVEPTLRLYIIYIKKSNIKMRETKIYDYRTIFSTLLWEQLNTDCNPYYRWTWSNNMYFLIKDFLYYLNLEKSLIRESQINALLEEFLYLIDSDIVFNKNFRKDSNELIYEIKDNKKDINKLKKNLNIIYKYFIKDNRYIKCLNGMLISYLNSNKYNEDYNSDYEKHVRNVKKLTFTFLTILKEEYWISRKYLESLRQEHLDKIDSRNSWDFEKWLNKFTKFFFTDDKNYIVYFKIKIWDIQANKKKIQKHNVEYVIKNINNNDIVYISDIEKELDWKNISEKFYEIKDSFMNKNEWIFYVGVNISWKDINTVYKIAKEKLNRLLDTFLYEFNALKLIISKFSLVAHEDVLFATNDTYIEYVNRKKSNEYNIIALNKILNNREYDFETKNKISNSIKYYKLFQFSENTEVKLLNLWIALESLFSNIESNDWAFEKLKSFIPKLISMNLMKNYFDEFQSFILHRIEMEEDKNSRYRNHEKIKKLISSNNIITNKDWEKEEKFNIVWIFKYFSTYWYDHIEKLLLNPYFKQKYKRLISKLETDESWQFKNLHTFLKRYEKNTKCLINRIYRYRNYIVHWWKKVDTENIINDLEFIYLELIDDILDKIWTDYLYIDSLEEYFSRINRTYNLYDKWINPRLKDHKIWKKNVVLPHIVF